MPIFDFVLPFVSMTKIILYDTQKDLQLDRSTLKEVTSFLIKEMKIATDEIIVHFVTEKKISDLHSQFFNDPTPTDCISFPIDGTSLSRHHILGELFICPKVAIAQSKHYQTTPGKELLRYLIHGLLHLIGYNDIETKERKIMKGKEGALLKKVIAQFPQFLYN